MRGPEGVIGELRWECGLVTTTPQAVAWVIHEAIGLWKHTHQTSEVSEDFGSLSRREVWPIAWRTTQLPGDKSNSDGFA